MENISNLKSIDIKYGELDIYYPLMFKSAFSFDEKIETIAERFTKFISKSLDKGIGESGLSLFKEAVEVYKKRAELIKEEYEESISLYGAVYTNSHERFLILPLKIELYNKQCVWLQAILYIFENGMGILKIELPLVNVNNIPLKKNDWNSYIYRATCLWDTQALELTTLEQIKRMYLSIISQECGLELIEYNEYLHHIILVDFDGCPQDVNIISDDVQEELFRTIAAAVDEAPYSSYRDEAKEYIKNNSWGRHNVRCILKSTGGCLSILDHTVQDYWIETYSQEKKANLKPDEYLDMYRQYASMIQNNTEFPFIILMLNRINILNDIRKKSNFEYNSKREVHKETRKAKYEYLENNIYISTIQEECSGTVSRQIVEFAGMMPYYSKKEITDAKRESLNEILREKENEKEERYQSFISIGSLVISLVFGLPAIQETVSLLRNVCIGIERDIPCITQNNISVVIWLIVNVIIYIKIKKFRV